MHQRTRIAVATGIAFLGWAGCARAVLVAGNDATYTSAPPGLAGWGNVGLKGVGGAVYIGNGWVLTANHVGFGDVTFNGVVYHGDPSTLRRLTEPGQPAGTTTDLCMFQVIGNTGLPNLTLATKTPAMGSQVTMVGYGTSVVSTPVYYGVQKSHDANGMDVWTWTQHSSAQTGDYSGYAYVDGQAKRWGSARTAGFTFQGSTFALAEFGDYDGGAVTYFATIYSGATGAAQGSGGDSGGAVFDASGTLVGITDAINFLPNQPDNTVIGDPSSQVNLNNASNPVPNESDIPNEATYITNIATYYPQIAAIVQGGAIPEPGNAAWAVGAGVLLRRWRRAR